jgi:AcrR family transcriptional regulator
MFNILTVRSAEDDRTARAVIRDEALRLFAARGPDAVTVRQVSAAAGVSPGLVMHHFGSKDGLREAVDQHVLALFTAMLGELTGGGNVFGEAAAGSLAEAVAAHLPAGSPVPAYLRRMLLDGGTAGQQLFAGLYQASRAALDALAAAGMAAPGHDPGVRAAVLLSNDLAVLLLQDQLAGVLGFDPLSAAGMTRWGAELLTIYAAGLTAPPPDGKGER